jgi:hypothetical protein
VQTLASCQDNAAGPDIPFNITRLLPFSSRLKKYFLNCLKTVAVALSSSLSCFGARRISMRSESSVID